MLKPARLLLTAETISDGIFTHIQFAEDMRICCKPQRHCTKGKKGRRLRWERIEDVRH